MVLPPSISPPVSPCPDNNSSRITVTPQPYDILCGRDKTCANHLGNRRFRAVVALSLQRYHDAPIRRDKSRIVKSVMDDLMSIGSRFIKCDKKTYTWYLIEDERVIADKIGHALRDNYPAEMIVGAIKFMKVHGFKLEGREVTVDNGTECDILPNTVASTSCVFDSFGNAVPNQEGNEGFLHQRQEEHSTEVAVYGGAVFAQNDASSSFYSSLPVFAPPTMKAMPENRCAGNVFTAPSLQHVLSSRQEWNVGPAHNLFAFGVPMDGREIDYSLQGLRDFNQGCGSEIEVGLGSFASALQLPTRIADEDDDDLINEINSLPLSIIDDTSVSNLLTSCLQRAVDI